MSLYYTERNGRAKFWSLNDCSYSYNHSSYNDQNEIQQLLAEYNTIINNLNQLQAISNEEIDSITGVSSIIDNLNQLQAISNKEIDSITGVNLDG